MKKITCCVVAIIVFLFAVGMIKVGYAVSRYENATTANTFESYTIYGTTWCAQSFTTTPSHTITGVNLTLGRYGAGATSVTVSVSINVASSGKPGAQFTWGTILHSTITNTIAEGGSWTYIPITEYTLNASTQYWIVVSTTGNSSYYVEWKGDNGGAGGAKYTTSGGGSWLNDGDVPTYSYEVYGNAVNSAPTIGSVSGTNWDDTDNCYAQQKSYTANITYTDTNGYADIQYCELYLVTGANVTRAEFYYLEDTPAVGTNLGSTTWTLDSTTSDFSRTGNNVVASWKFSAQWDATEESDLDFLFFVIYLARP